MRQGLIQIALSDILFYVLVALSLGSFWARIASFLFFAQLST
jgi:hypothetical protein